MIFTTRVGSNCLEPLNDWLFQDKKKINKKIYLKKMSSVTLLLNPNDCYLRILY